MPKSFSATMATRNRKEYQYWFEYYCNHHNGSISKHFLPRYCKCWYFIFLSAFLFLSILFSCPFRVLIFLFLFFVFLIPFSFLCLCFFFVTDIVLCSYQFLKNPKYFRIGHHETGTARMNEEFDRQDWVLSHLKVIINNYYYIIIYHFNYYVVIFDLHFYCQNVRRQKKYLE